MARDGLMEQNFMKKIRDVKASCWSHNGIRAPHKPLLLLLALGRLRVSENRLVLYQALEEPLTELLKDFGPQRSTYRPELPFWHLKTNGLWEIQGSKVLNPDSRRSPTRGMLKRHNFKGGIPKQVHDLLRGDPGLLQETVKVLLYDNFPETWHNDIRSAVGLLDEGEKETASGPSRNPQFRREVLRAYGHCCAVCNFDIRLDDNLLGLEAAHIKWHAAGGPDEVSNGLALCVTHHKVFDRGALGLEQIKPKSYKIVVSKRVNGSSDAAHELRGLSGKPLHSPQSADDFPDCRYIDWHRSEIFKGKAIS